MSPPRLELDNHFEATSDLDTKKPPTTTTTRVSMKNDSSRDQMESANHEKAATPSLRSILKYLLWSISVEPVMFFMTGGFSIYTIIVSTGTFWKICHMEFDDKNDTGINCDTRNLTKSAENLVQQTTATWSIYGSLAQILPLVIIGPIYGAIGDRYGRKFNLMMGMLGLILFGLFNILQFTFIMLPLYVLPIAGVFICLTGFIGTVFSSAFAYVTDETRDQHLLTFRLTLLSVASSCSDIIFGLVAANVLHFLSYANSMLLPIALWGVGLFYTLIFLQQVPPGKMIANSAKREQEFFRSGGGVTANKKDLSSGMSVNGSATTTTADWTEKQENGHVTQEKDHVMTEDARFKLSDIWSILKELVTNTIEAVTKRREGRKRLYIWITVFDFLILNSCQMGLGVVLSLFSMHSPINWGQTEIAYYHVFNSVVQLLGTMGGTFVMKRLLNLHETSMLIVTLVSAIAKCVMIGFSVNGAMLYLASILGVVSNLTFPVCKSLTAQFVQRDEIGKIFALYQISTDLSIIFAFSAFNSFYAATVGIHAGMVFLFIAFLGTVALLPLIFVHVDFKRFRTAKAKAAA